MSKEDEGLIGAAQLNATNANGNKLSLDQVAYYLLKQNFILTALELHTELAETSREVPRLRDFFSNPANFEQQTTMASSLSGSNNAAQMPLPTNSSGGAFYPLHKASSIQTFDSLDLTRYSDDADQNKFQDDKIAVLEFELRKAKETINQLRNTLTLATENHSTNQSKSSLNVQNTTNSDKLNESNANLNVSNDNANFRSGVVGQSSVPAASQSGLGSAASASNDQNAPIKFGLNHDMGDYEENGETDDYDYVTDLATGSSSSSNVGQSASGAKLAKSSRMLMPHDKHAINFLINEYLLENEYKMTSITFAEENESQDLEDWDVVGVNRAKPPNLIQLYKFYLKKDTLLGNNGKCLKGKPKESLPTISKTDAEVQVDQPATTSTATNTNLVEMRQAETLVNFDRETFENQRTQINKLLEKQEILLKSLTKLESEIGSLTSERESYLKKIDLLTISLEKANKTIKANNEREQLIATSKSLLNGESCPENTPTEATSTSEPKSEEVQVNDENDSEIPGLTERKMPVVFKEVLNKYLTIELNENQRNVIEEIENIKKVDDQILVKLLNKYLPKILPNVNPTKRIDLLPIILKLALLEQEDIEKNKTRKECHILRLLFNLLENPNMEERYVILNVCIHFIKLVGPMYVNNHLLPLCWEQLNDKSDEKRMLVAEACALLAPHIYNDIRSSLMFSILKQIIEEETSEMVRECAVKSFAILINYISDEKKFNQCIELLDLCATDPSERVIEQVEKYLMPCLSLWALNSNKLTEPLINHLIEKADYHMSNSNRQKFSVKKNESDLSNLIDHESHALTYMNLIDLNIQFIFAFVLISFRGEQTQDQDSAGSLEIIGDVEETAAGAAVTDTAIDKKLPKLNSYFLALNEKLANRHELYKIDCILEDYLNLTIRYLSLIESDCWSSVDLSKSFEWLSDRFLRKLIQMSVQVDARTRISNCFVNIFKNFTLMFAIDYEFIKSKIIPIFEKLLNIPTNELDSNQQSAMDQLINTKSSPLFKSTLPVYFVGILSTLVDAEINGSFNLNSDLIEDVSFKSESSLSPFTPITSDKVMNCSQYSANTNNRNKHETTLSSSGSASKKNQTPLDKRIEYMNNYLKNVFFALSLNQANLDGLISVYELMKQKSKTADYVIQMLLSTLWDGIVHTSLYVRCNTAKLFEILVKDCDEYLLSTRILPALITLANDLDKMVRCSSISPLTSIVENCTNREILERVYTQMQSFLSDPILKDDYILQIELLKSFRRISTRVNAKFREELILPYLTILTMQIKNVINENDYEFSLASISLAFSVISTLPNSISMSAMANASPLTAVSSSSTSSISSYNSTSTSTIKESQFANHQQDVIKICVLLFDNYQKLCWPNSNESAAEVTASVSLSRQSVKESIVPGLQILKDIFQNKIITGPGSASSHSLSVTHQNDYHATIETMIHRLENTLSDSPNTNVTPNSATPHDSHLLNTPVKVSPNPMATNAINNTAVFMNDLVSASVQSLSNATTHITTGTSNVDNNFKSMVFKGISNLNNSKDKLSSLLAHKSFKK